MSSKPNSRDRRRLLQNGSSKAPKSAAKPARDRSSLPGFDQHPELPLAAKTPGSTAKKQQSKLNTPTKARSTPAGDEVAADWGGWLDGPSAQKAPAAADPYEFPVDAASDALVAAAAAAVNPPPRPQQTWVGKRLEGLHHLQPHKSSLTGLVSAGGVTASKRSVFSSNRQLDFNSAAATHGICNVGTSISGLRTGTAADVATSASAGHSKQWLAAAAGGRQKQTGIRNFTVPQVLLSPTASGSLPAGMVNHGNTCYLNAVLQALLGLKCLDDDLSSSRLQQLSLSSSGVTHALQSCLRHCSSSGGSYGSDRAISPAAVSAAMAQLDSRWGLSRQEDAHEFLTALLDALQTEVLTAQAALLASKKTAMSTPCKSSTNTATTEQHAAGSAAVTVTGLDDSSNDALHEQDHAAAAHASADHGPCVSASAALDPSSRNFTGCLQHTLTCSCCGHVTTVKEQFNHLSLDLPALGSFLQSQQSQEPPCSSGVVNLLGGIGSSEQVVPELQSLLANFFAPEMLEKSCEVCKAAAVQHSLQHAVRRLPRVLVVHLKRFQWQVLTGGGAICRKMSTRVKADHQLHLGGVCCPGRPVPPLIAELAPPGFIERAQQAMQEQQTAVPTAPASPRRTLTAVGATQQQEAAAPAAAVTGVGFKRTREVETETQALLDGQQHNQIGNASKAPQPEKQQNLLTAWGQNRVAGKSRFERMMTINGQGFHANRGARHTDLTKLVQQPEQHKQLSHLNSDPAVLDQGHDSDVKDDLGGVDGLKRNNSSTALVDLVQDDAEDAELQRAIAESLKMQEEEQQQPSAVPVAEAEEEDDDQGPPNKAARLAVQMSPASPAADRAADDDDLPDWVNQHHAASGGRAAAAAGYRSPPSTPRSSPKLKFKPNVPGRRRILYTNASNSRSRQPLTDLTGQDDLYSWGADRHMHDHQQQDSVDADTTAGANGSGNVGLSGGLAFSDPAAAGASGEPASVQQQQRQQQQTGSVGGLFDGLPLLSAAAAAAGDGGGFMPGSPTCLQSGRAAGARINGRSNNGSNDSSVMHIDNNALGLSGLTENQQLALAIEQSMKEQQQQQQDVGDSNSGPAKVLAGIDVDNYDEQAALEKALAESAAAADQQVTSSGAAAAPSSAAAGSDQLFENAQQCSSDGVADHEQQPSATAAAAGDSDVAEDDTVVLVHESTEAAAGQQQQVRPRLTLGRLVEDSDCEDHAQLDADFDQSQQQQQQPTTPQPMEVDLLVQPPSDVAAVTTVSSAVKSIAPVADKENANQLQHAGASGKPSKQRRPFGKILSDVNTNVPAVLAPNSALEPPVKQAGVAAAVAASQAAAASAAALDSGDLAAVEAAAAAEAVGHWPQEDAAMYKLRAVVRHKGPLASSGHFVSDVKSNLQSGVWFHYDDSYVQPTKFPNVVRDCQQDGYLFFYVNSAILPLQAPKGA